MYSLSNLLSGLQNIAIQGTPVGAYQEQQKQQQKQSQIAALINNPNLSIQQKQSALAALSPEFAGQMAMGLTPQSQSEMKYNDLRYLDTQNQMDFRQQDQARQNAEYARQEQARLQQQAQQQKLQNYFAGGGDMNPRSLAALGVPLQEAATIGKSFQPVSLADLYEQQYGSKPETGFKPVLRPDGTIGQEPIAGSTRDPNSPNNQEYQEKQKTIIAAEGLKSAIRTYDNLVSQYGVPAIGSKEEAAIRNAHRTITTRLKDAEKLGTLDAGTLEFVQGYMPDVTTFGNRLDSLNPFTDSIRKQVSGAASQAYTSIDNTLNTLGANKSTPEESSKLDAQAAAIKSKYNLGKNNQPKAPQGTTKIMIYGGDGNVSKTIDYSKKKDSGQTMKKDALSFIMNDLEGGGKTVIDINGAPVKYGVNQAYSGGNVDNLSEQGARDFYQKNYNLDGFVPASASDGFRLVAQDAIIQHGKDNQTKAMIEASGGDPMKLLQIRAQYIQQLAQKDPQKYMPIMNGLMNRYVKLANQIQAMGAA